MIAETIGLTTTVYDGNIYEKKNQGGTITQKKYYYAGSLRVAVSTKVGAGSWEVNLLLSDHLGSTSTTVDSSGGRIADLRYKPWGSTRCTWGTQMTDFTYTGQLHHRRQQRVGLYRDRLRWDIHRPQPHPHQCPCGCQYSLERAAAFPQHGLLPESRPGD
jgi:hypothetical protein